MTLPSSGPISLGQVRDELKLNGTISLSQEEIWIKLKLVPHNENVIISLKDLYTKNYKFTETINVSKAEDPNSPDEICFFSNTIIEEFKKRNIEIPMGPWTAKKLRAGSVLYSRYLNKKVVFTRVEIVAGVQCIWSADVYEGV